MQEKSQHYLFLYTRLPDYFFRCIEYLIKNSPAGSEARIVCYPKDTDAPYHYENVPDTIRILEKKDLTMVLNDWLPDVIYIAGWGDNVYNQFARKWIKEIPVIIGMDNPWKNTLKQRLAVLASSFFLKNRATHLWVAGYPQYEYARRIGFPANRILHDLYCADTVKFRKTERPFQKRVMFIGRMVEYKRPGWLLGAFSELLARYPELQEWELVMIGNGPLQQKLQSKYANIQQVSFAPFVQPVDLVQYYHQSLIFCMTSLFEHWGVVVQEAAAAGLTLLLSDTCGAASTFLIHGYNGFIFDSNSKADLQQKLYRLMNTAPVELQQMGKRSEILAQRITQDTWVGNLKSVLNDKN